MRAAGKGGLGLKDPVPREIRPPDYATGPRYFPIEYTACKLLEFMVVNEPRGPFSLYALMGALAHCQRRDRVRWILERLIGLGLVEAVGGRYRVTGSGRSAYWAVRWTLEFSEGMRLGKPLRSLPAPQQRR
jgi:hypothetical protein